MYTGTWTSSDRVNFPGDHRISFRACPTKSEDTVCAGCDLASHPRDSASQGGHSPVGLGLCRARTRPSPSTLLPAPLCSARNTTHLPLGLPCICSSALSGYKWGVLVCGGHFHRLVTAHSSFTLDIEARTQFPVLSANLSSAVLPPQPLHASSEQLLSFILLSKSAGNYKLLPMLRV